jgi:adenine-specific DNA-methyltransferase
MQNQSFIMRKDAIEEIYEITEKAKREVVSIVEGQRRLKEFYRKQGFDRGITLYCELDPNYEIWGKINMSWPNAQTEGPRYEVISPVTSKPVPIPTKGWRWTEDTFREAEKNGPLYQLPDGSIMKGRIWYAADERTQPSSITYLREVESFLLRSFLSIKSDGSISLDDLGLSGLIDYPKPILLMERLCYSVQSHDGLFLDYFGGSGTTAHAIINLNREDKGSRKYILVEMGDQFEKVLTPRIKKVVYSSEWKDGKPTTRKGCSHSFKYIHLESYEDALNNLYLYRDKSQGELITKHPDLREDYTLRYMLDVESEGSASLLNVDWFADPLNYKMKISTGTVGETVERNVDLVETFNYLLGLRVKHIDTIRGFKIVEGTNPEGEKVLVIWRNTKEKSNPELDEFFQKQGYNTKDNEYNIIYVNGDNNLENLRREDETWKVRLIEEDFKRLMFDVEGM